MQSLTKFAQKYDLKIKEYENKVKELETAVKAKVVQKPSEEDMVQVRNEILQGLDKSRAIADCLDSIVKQRLDRKIKSGELSVDSTEVTRLRSEVESVKKRVSDVEYDVDILNPDPFEQEHLCVVCSGVVFEQGENPKSLALDIIRDLGYVMDSNGEEFECDVLQVLGAKRLGSAGQRYPPLLKIALASQEQKVALLRAKKWLAKSEVFSDVRMRSSKSNLARVMESNLNLIKDNTPGLESYRVAGNSRFVPKVREQSGSDNGRVRGRGGRRSRGGRDFTGGRGGRGSVNGQGQGQGRSNHGNNDNVEQQSASPGQGGSRSAIRGGGQRGRGYRGGGVRGNDRAQRGRDHTGGDSGDNWGGGNFLSGNDYPPLHK